MLQPSTLVFLSDLKVNNTRQWFDANRPAYETAKGDFVGLVARLIDGLNQIDPAIADTSLQAKKCVFRINRDVRFSTNKSPYKTNFGAWFNKGGKALNSAGYYINLEPGDSFIAGGLYMPDAPLLATIRQEVDYNLPAFQALLDAPAFREYFTGLNRDEALQRPPKGYSADNPAIDYLKLKSFTASHRLTDNQLVGDGLHEHIVSGFSALKPLVDFLNQGVA